jgi:octaprenyl-diphosphate synthase
MMVQLKNMRVMEILSEATNVIAEGEVLQLLNIHNAEVTEQQYLKVIHYKTAKLFEAAMRLGAVINQASKQDEDALALYGMKLGTAFQLVDDVLDLSGDHNAIGKNLGDDLSEGKPTLPLLYAIQNSSPQQANALRKAIKSGGLADLDRVLAVVRATQANEYVLGVAKQESLEGCSAIAHFPDSIYKQSLLDLADFAVTRSY